MSSSARSNRKPVLSEVADLPLSPPEAESRGIVFFARSRISNVPGIICRQQKILPVGTHPIHSYRALRPDGTADAMETPEGLLAHDGSTHNNCSLVVFDIGRSNFRTIVDATG